MRKLILARWDIAVGPQFVLQFPPEAEFPPKEILLKMWARYEINSESNFIIHYDEEHNQAFCALLKTQRMTGNKFFILLELKSMHAVEIFQEILENVADDLLSGLDSPHFHHLLSDTYRSIVNQSALDDFDLYLRVFEDKIRLVILDFLRKGVITKQQLKTEIQSKFGQGQLNIELLISPLLRLGCIRQESIPGNQDSLLLCKDPICVRLPPAVKPKNPIIIDIIRDTFTGGGIINPDQLAAISKVFQVSGVRQMMDLLKESKGTGIPVEVGLTVIRHDESILQELSNLGFIYETLEQKYYLVSEPFFMTIIPSYLPPILVERNKKGEISSDQLYSQIIALQELLKYYKSENQE